MDALKIKAFKLVWDLLNQMNVSDPNVVTAACVVYFIAALLGFVLTVVTVSTLITTMDEYSWLNRRSLIDPQRKGQCLNEIRALLIKLTLIVLALLVRINPVLVFFVVGLIDIVVFLRLVVFEFLRSFQNFLSRAKDLSI